MATLAPGDCAIATVTIYDSYASVDKCVNSAKERANVDLLLKALAELAFRDGLAKEAIMFLIFETAFLHGVAKRRADFIEGGTGF